MRGGSRRLGWILEQLVEFLQPGVRAYLVKSLCDLEAGELAPFKERLLDLGQIHDLVTGEPVESGAPEDSEAVVDVVHGGKPVPLVVGPDGSVMEPDVAGVVEALVLKNGHQA